MTEHEKILNRSANWRGTILHDISIMERYMDLFIANYFCETDEKKTEFIDLILGNNRLSLDGKRKLIDNIFQQNIERWKAKLKLYSTHVDTAIKERNFFAHSSTDFSDEAYLKCDTHLGLLKFGINARTDWYDIDRMNEIQLAIRTVTAFFMSATGNDIP